MIGIMWGVIAGLGFGLFQTLNRRAGQGLDVFRATFILLLVCTVLMIIASVATEDLSILRKVPWSAFINLGLAGFFHFLVGWTLLSVSQQRVGAARTGALVGASPLFATAIAAVTIGEVLSLPTLLGIILVVTGVYLVSGS